jgi:hypothetical protein
MLYFVGLAVLGTVFYILYKLGIQFFKVILENDIPHLIDTSTDRVLKKVINKTRSIKANRAKTMKAQGMAPQMDGWMGIVGSILQSPAGQQMIGNFLSGLGGPKQPPPQGGTPQM